MQLAAVTNRNEVFVTAGEPTAPPVALYQCAVAISGSYRRGEHMLDPRTGRPPGNEAISRPLAALSG